MSIGVAFAAMTVGAALVGFWSVVRFPELAAWSRESAAVVLAGACVLLAAMAPLSGLAMAHVGIQGALLLVVLPTLTTVFWAAGSLIRLAARS
jgi:hypothetical protein